MGTIKTTKINLELSDKKYKQALAYFVRNCNNQSLGVTKLNKLFYYLDFVSYRDRGQSVTGETYKNLPKGPVAKNLEAKITAAKNEGLIKFALAESTKYPRRFKFAPNKEPDMSVFDPYEKKLLESICCEFKNWTTDMMIAQTHLEAPWVFSEPGSILNFEDSDDIELFPEMESFVKMQ